MYNKNMVKPAHTFRIDLRAVIYREEKHWIAHCLELDVVAEGKSQGQALSDLIDLCDFQIRVALEESDLESIFRPAPPQAWKMFTMGESIRLPRKKAAMQVHRFEARELELV